MTFEERERLMSQKVAALSKPEVEGILANARQRKAKKPEAACIARLAELGAPVGKPPLVRDWWRTLIASETAQREFTPGFRHSRIRQMYDRRVGSGLPEETAVKEIMIVCVERKDPSDGFKKLVDLDLYEYTDEARMLRFPSEFTPELLAIARERLARFGWEPK
jgi:hypothetical protein